MRGTFKIFKGPEKEVYDKCLEHVNLMVEGGELLHEAVEVRDYNRFSEIAEKIVRLEQDCDQKSQETTELIIKRVKNPVLRTNMLKLVIKLQHVAKAIESAAFRITMCHNFDLSEQLKQEMLEMTDSVIATLHALEAVSYMSLYKKETMLEEVNKIHIEEEKVDKAKRILLCDFLSEAHKVSHKDFYLFMELVNCLENVADRSERVAETMKIIISS